MELPKIVSLFSGAGGLDLGFKDANFDVEIATDISPAAMATHNRNFPNTNSYTADLRKVGADGIVDIVSKHIAAGQKIGVIGGPPCQGFSRANVKSGSTDPRNQLAQLYLTAVEALQRSFKVEFLLFENVLGIRDKRNSDAFSGITTQLEAMGLYHAVREFCAVDFGVPQMRRRVIISGFEDVHAAARFSKLEGTAPAEWNSSVRSAIAHLVEPAYWSRDLPFDQIPHHPNHWTMRPKSKRFDGQSSATNTRSFKRLDWEKPSPTVAYGHREIHVHPAGHRRLSIFEAMMLQGFPEEFQILGTLSEQVEQVSNAVPPPMARQLAEAVQDALKPHSEAEEQL